VAVTQLKLNAANFIPISLSLQFISVCENERIVILGNQCLPKLSQKTARVFLSIHGVYSQ